MKKESTNTVFIADGDLLVCELLREILNNRGLNVVSFATQQEEVIRLIRRFEPDVAIIGCSQKKLNGIEVMKKLEKDELDTEFIIISDDENCVKSVCLSKIDIKGHLLKGFGISELYYCIQEVINNRTFLASSVRKIIEELDIDTFQDTSASVGMITTLTRREIEILKALSDSYTTPKIAEKLFISHATVNNHRAKIMEKLNIKGRNQLLSFAISARNLF